MVIESANGFFELRVGPYKLGLPTRVVVGVVEQTADRELLFRGRSLRVVDLRTLFATDPAVAEIPRVLVVEPGSGRPWVGIGVDAVGTMPIPDTIPLLRVPPVGLERPTLLRGAVRWKDALVYVLEVDALVKAVS